MSYSERFLERHAPQAEDTIAEPKLMDDDDEDADANGMAHDHNSSSRRSHRRGASRTSHREAHAPHSEKRTRSLPGSPQPFEVLGSPHRRPPDAHGPPQVAGSRKVFVSPRAAHNTAPTTTAASHSTAHTSHSQPKHDARAAAPPPPQARSSTAASDSDALGRGVGTDTDLTVDRVSQKLRLLSETREEMASLVARQRQQEQGLSALVDELRRSSAATTPTTSPARSAAPATTGASQVKRSDAAKTNGDNDHDRLVTERDVALRLLDKFKTEGNKVIQRLREALVVQQEENAELSAALAAAGASSSSSASAAAAAAAAGRPHDGPATTLRVIELEEKVMAQEHVIHELDKLMRSADTMLLAMRARCDAAEYRCRRLEEEAKRSERQGHDGSRSPAAAAESPGRAASEHDAAGATSVPPLDLDRVQGSSADAAAPSKGLPGELLANRLRETYAADPDVQAAVSQWMAAQAHVHSLRANLEDERRLRLHAEEAYQRATTENARSIQLLERRLHRAQTPRGMPYRGFDADLLQVPLELAPSTEAAGAVPARRSVVTLSAANNAPVAVVSGGGGEAREDGSRTPPSPIERGARNDEARSTQSTPTKMLFTLGSETADTRLSQAVVTAASVHPTAVVAASAPSRSSRNNNNNVNSVASSIVNDDGGDEVDAVSYESMTVPVDASESVVEQRDKKAAATANTEEVEADLTSTAMTGASTDTKRRRKKKKSHHHHHEGSEDEGSQADAAERVVPVEAPPSVAPAASVAVERDLTRRRDSSEPSTPHPPPANAADGDSAFATSHAAAPPPAPQPQQQQSVVRPESKPPLTPRSPRPANSSSATRKRFVGEGRRSEPASANASITTVPGSTAPVAAAGVVDIPVPEVLTSAAASVRNASFGSAASSRASSVGSRSGRLVNLRPRSPHDEAQAADDADGGGDDVEVPVAPSNVADRLAMSGSGRRHSPRLVQSSAPAAAAPAAPVPAVSEAAPSSPSLPDNNNTSDTKHHKHYEDEAQKVSARDSRGRSSRVSEERQHALSQGLEELDQINADMDQILRSLSRGTR